MASVAAGKITDEEEKRAHWCRRRGGEGRRKPDTAEAGDGSPRVEPIFSFALEELRDTTQKVRRAYDGQGPCLVNPKLKGGINPTNPD